MMFLITIAGVLAGTLIKNLDNYKWVGLLFCGVLFHVLLVLSMEWNRMRKGCFDEKANNFARITIAYVVCSASTVGCLFFPEYVCPVFVFSALMTMVSTSFIGMISGTYFSLLLCLSGRGSIYLLACYLLLNICGCIMIEYFGNKKNQLWNGLVALTFCFCCVMLFSYLEEFQVKQTIFLHGIVNGTLSAGLALLFHYMLDTKMDHKKEYTMRKIIREDYSLVRAMKAHSKIDYEHARKVSDIALQCAKMVDANFNIAAAGGFYYRLGKLEGKPYIENGVNVARRHLFPREVIDILSEYNGELMLPSTIESALVHIVDTVVAKFELIDKATLSSSWNQDIIVYQTLNEKSAQGLYDKAGLSMNMFLKIRDYLIKEANLY
ncbi:hypothetical protein LQZ18_00715 [Lachnospiraceae bacterium ZAX-1]